MPERGELVTPEWVAEYLCLSVRTVYLRVLTKKIPFHRIGRNIRFFKSEIEAWVREKR